MQSSVDGTQAKCSEHFVGNDEDQSAVAIKWRRCEDNIKTNLTK
jgi:hypothetical protein